MEIYSESESNFPSIFVYTMDAGIQSRLVKFADDMEWRGDADILRDRIGTENALDKLKNSQNSCMNFNICRNNQLPHGQQELAQWKLGNVVDAWISTNEECQCGEQGKCHFGIYRKICVQHIASENIFVSVPNTEGALAKCYVQFQSPCFRKHLRLQEDSRRE